MLVVVFVVVGYSQVSSSAYNIISTDTLSTRILEVHLQTNDDI